MLASYAEGKAPIRSLATFAYVVRLTAPGQVIARRIRSKTQQCGIRLVGEHGVKLRMCRVLSLVSGNCRVTLLVVAMLHRHDG